MNRPNKNRHKSPVIVAIRATAEPVRFFFSLPVKQRQWSFRSGIISLVSCLAAFVALPHRAQALELSYGGRLAAPTGEPLAGPLDMMFRFYRDAAGGSALVTINVANVPLVDGMFQVPLNIAGEDLDRLFGDGEKTVFVEVESQGKIYPRQKFGYVPLALRVPVDGSKIVYDGQGRLTLGSGAMTSSGTLPGATGTGGVEKVGDQSYSTYPLTAAGKALIGAADLAAQKTLLGLGALDGVTGPVQTQLNSKMPLSGGNMTGSLTVTQGNELRLGSTNPANGVGFKSPADMTTSTVYTWPGAFGASGQVLTTGSTGVLSWTDIPLTTVNGRSGNVSLNADDIGETTGRKYYSHSLARQAISATGLLGYNASTGALSLSDTVLTRSGGTMTGSIDMGGTQKVTNLADPTAAGDAAKKAYVDGKLGGQPLVVGTPSPGQVIKWDGSKFALASDAVGEPGGGIASLNNLTSSSQSLAVETPGVTSGTRPAWTADSGTSTHTLTIPLASASGVSAGLLSKTDYDVFSAKQAAITSSSPVEVGSITTNLQSALDIKPYGTQSSQTGELRFRELAGSGANFVGLKAPDALAGDVVWTLPNGVGTSGQVLSTGAGGVLSWISLPSAPVSTVAGRTGAVSLTSGDISGLSALATASAVSGGTGGTISDDSITDADIKSGAAIATTKLSGPVTSIPGHGLGSLATLNSVSGGASGTIIDGTITNDDISGSAAIAQSKIANLTTDLAAKEPTITDGTSAQYYRGDKSWQTLNTTAVPEGSNLYFSNTRARQAFSANGPLAYDTSTGVMSITQASTVANGFLSSSDFVSFNAKQAAINSSTILNAGTLTSAMQNGLEIKPYGSTVGTTGELRFDELAGNGSNFVGFKAPDALAADVVWTLPNVVGTSGQVLSTGAGGALSWISIPSAPVTTVAGRTGAVTLTSGDISGLGALATASAVSGGATGTIADGTITNDDIAANAAIADSKLATITTGNKVSNSATTATSANTNNAIVARDASGNFAAGTITATLNGTATNVTGTVAVTNGGTGATAAPQARTNLGAAASGANSDITSLTGLTTALSVAQGGTGAATATQARSNLGAAASGANTDITSLTNLTSLTTTGNVGIGTSAPRTALDLSSRTDAIALPSGTSGQQPPAPVAGWMRYNSTSNTIEFYNGSIWTAASNAVDPAGMIGAFPMSSCPSGWLEANGAAVSRTTYSSLFTAIGTSYGPGDGSTTFNLPDYRGYFLRGWNHGASNDPDASTRTNRGDSTTGDNVGTKQADQYGTHAHNLGQSFSATIFGWATSTGATAGWVTAGSTATSSSGGNETRPKNINVTYCVSTASIQAVTTASSGSGTTNYLPQWTSSTALGNSPIAVNGGNVGIGTTSPTQALEVTQSIRVNSGASSTTDCPAGWGCSYFRDISISSIYYNGLTQRSDKRLKTNVQTLNDSDLARLEQLQPVSYEWINPMSGSGTKYGFIAQEVEKIWPEIVTTATDAQQTKSMDYTALIAPLVLGMKDYLHQKHFVTVNQSGNVGIGTTNPGYTLHVNGSVAGNGAYIALSDIRFKKDVEDLVGSLAKVLAIRGVSYKWIDEERNGSGTQYGVIAQEIEKILPNVVVTGSDGIKRVKYDDLIPLIIEALKAEKASKDEEIDHLKAESDRLKAESDRLKAESDQLKIRADRADAESAQLKAESRQLKASLCGKFPDLPVCSN